MDEITAQQRSALAMVIGHLSVCGEGARRANAVTHIHRIIDAFPIFEHMREDYTGETKDRVPADRHMDVTPELPPTTDRARHLGSEAGKAAASWVFDGNTRDATYRTFLKWRSPRCWLEVHDDVATAYEEAADSAYWSELERVARLQTQDGQ